jgi:diguanylate cyclase (GGDEF)-like protein
MPAAAAELPVNGNAPPEKARPKPKKPAQWELWTKPRPMVAFLIGWEIIAVAALVYGIIAAGPTTGIDWVRLAALAACSTAQIQLTRRQEERRRNRLSAVHIDLSGIWIFPAALVLPLYLTLVLLTVVRLQRWVNSRRAPHKFLFTTLTWAVSALVAQRLFEVLAVDQLGRLDEANPVRLFGVLMLAGLAYAGVQVIAIGTLLALGGTSTPTLRNVLGSKSDNLLDLSTISLGTVGAILLVNLLPAIVILVLVSVVGNRLAEINQLQSEARTDPKTGVFNVRGWTEAAQRSMGRASKSEEGLAVLMIDLDHFKWINDTFGHPAGDDVLRTVAQLLDEVTRPGDVIGRFGGEEFVVLLPEIDNGAAGTTAERIRSAVAELEIDTTDKRGGRTTVAGRTTSIGVAVYPHHGDSIDTLLQAADAAVYEAKESGRNRVRIATSAVPQS